MVSICWIHISIYRNDIVWTLRIRSLAISFIIFAVGVWNTIGVEMLKRMKHPHIRYDKWKSAFLLILSSESGETVSFHILRFFLGINRKCQPYEMCWIFVFSLKLCTHATFLCVCICVWVSLSWREIRSINRLSELCFIWIPNVWRFKRKSNSPFLLPILTGMRVCVCVFVFANFKGILKQRPLFEHLSMADSVSTTN